MKKLPVIEIGLGIQPDIRSKAWNYKGEFWYQQTLYHWVKDLEPFDLPLAGIPIGYNPWELESMADIAWHFGRISEVSFDYPIILDENGAVIDGHHRIVKALMEGRETIKAVRIMEMPIVDGKKEQS